MRRRSPAGRGGSRAGAVRTSRFLSNHQIQASEIATPMSPTTATAATPGGTWPRFPK